MMYENMPMMIFILAAGYLFTVYLLLALAKRTGKNSGFSTVASAAKTKHQSIHSKVTEVVNTH